MSTLIMIKDGHNSSIKAIRKKLWCNFYT